MFLSFLLVLGACESTQKEYVWDQDAGTDVLHDTLDDATDSGADADGGDAAVVTDPPLDISGVWARKMYNYSIVNYPMIGPMDSVNISVVRSEITQDGTTLLFMEETCAMRSVSNTDLVSVIFPDAFVSSIPIEAKEGEWQWTPQGYRLLQYKFWQVQGAHLDNPAEDTMPVDAEDPRVFDQDLDEYPGVTIRATGLLAGEIYIVHRIYNQLSGMNNTMERLDGTILWGDEQITIGASRDLLATTIERSVHPDPSLSWYRFRPVDASTTCADIVTNEASIFPLMNDLFW
ncbi:hypothetical protein KKF84_07545 [Myxococcota bacterium]|nr:hypothetical protein [Myxococcota bacterium]MBU1535158.1 hypothetical protein [Myxococcota bacterium]